MRLWLLALGCSLLPFTTARAAPDCGSSSARLRLACMDGAAPVSHVRSVRRTAAHPPSSKQRPAPALALSRRERDPNASIELRPLAALCQEVAPALRVLRMRERLLRNLPPLPAHFLYSLHRAYAEILEHFARDPNLVPPDGCLL
jgi:hypothetical protein